VDPTTSEAVVATGRTPVAGAWRIATYTGEEGRAADGSTTPGLPCIRLVLARPPAGTPFRADGYCGQQGKGGFTLSELPIFARREPIEMILWGEAPEGAVRVELGAAGGRSLRARTLEGAGPPRGKVWAIAAPPGLREARVRWIDSEGAVGGSLDASASFRVRLAPD
jgi:hypothetical protein